MSVRLRKWLGLALLAAAPWLHAEEQWSDYAKVLRAEPLAGTESPCELGTTPGDLRAEEPGLGLAEAVRRLAGETRCAPAAPVAWRVVYRYEGMEYTRVLPYDPGERLRVEVRLDPRP